jgi:hypothetical protein
MEPNSAIIRLINSLALGRGGRGWAAPRRAAAMVKDPYPLQMTRARLLLPLIRGLLTSCSAELAGALSEIVAL